MFKATAFIAGEAIGADSELEEYPLYSVLDGSMIGSIPLLNRQYQRKIVESAWSGFEKWSQVDHEVREKYFFQFSAKLRENSRLLVQLIYLESGKSKEEAQKELDRSIEYVNESIHAFHALYNRPKEFNSERYPLIPENLNAVYLRVPLGAVLSITPFNYPLNSIIVKIVPAILMGNSVIQKCSMKGSLTGWLVCKIFNELSVDNYLITPGVLNYYTGSGAELEKFITEEQVSIAALSFTGSSRTGLSISKALPGIPQSLELSALNVAFLLEDADLELSAREIFKGAYGMGGQRCTSIQLVCVPKSISRDFIREITDKLTSSEGKTFPLISENAVSKVREAYKDALDKGARLVSSPVDWENIRGTETPNILFTGVSFEMTVAKEELFGPIAGIIEYEELDDAIRSVNKLGYSLQSSIFSADIKKAGEIALKIDVGRVNINLAPARSPDFLPFPSSRKSGNGEQGIVNSLYFFSKFRGIVYISSGEKTKS